MIEVDVTDAVAADVEADILRRIEKGAHDGLVAIAMVAQATVQQSILKGPKTGRLYKRGSRAHRASAPGEAPANDFGFLAASLRVDAPAPQEVNLRETAPYAAFLEYGTRNMKARPHFRVGCEKAGKDGGKIIAAAVDAALR